MKSEFSGIERRLEKLSECLTKLEPLKTKSFDDFEQDPYLRDIVERNLEVAAQCCIDIANRVISIEDLEKPEDYYSAFITLGQAGILPLKFARSFAGIAGFRNILVHEYIQIDWHEVYRNLHRLDDFYHFADCIKAWMKK
ncbi:hypothetical protein MTHERMOG20_26290 [Moorella thermoacetica]|uniref:type VII toxin-antitoxin system HepT family RNase toxin n=1 Tax=Neomoorella thermoacetica TaxID=1525 RepID=UPI00003CB014|nr:DUF86 domain-containing protein [Moorella thermoacetica]GLI18175.1 hypothetical protein MTHERMOG20_26290 [Moorella thermoacetica]